MHRENAEEKRPKPATRLSSHVHIRGCSSEVLKSPVVQLQRGDLNVNRAMSSIKKTTASNRISDTSLFWFER